MLGYLALDESLFINTNSLCSWGYRGQGREMRGRDATSGAIK